MYTDLINNIDHMRISSLYSNKFYQKLYGMQNDKNGDAVNCLY